ncbi:MAG: hypothetical protein ACI9VO_002424, partial [Colwellia sp.]
NPRSNTRQYLSLLASKSVSDLMVDIELFTNF